MGIENNTGKINKLPTVPELPRELAEEFLNGSLDANKPLVHEGDNSRIWRCLEREAEVPNIGKALLRVDYRKFENQEEHFDQVRFDYVKPESDSAGINPLIAEMHWYIEKGESSNPYPFDLMMVHRYVMPEYRESRGVGKSLYADAESWAQQVADAKGENITLSLSTDQPLTMKWAEGLGYTPYSGEKERYQEFIEHPEQFELIEETDSKGQLRNPVLRRDGKSHRIWFQKVLSPRK